VKDNLNIEKLFKDKFESFEGNVKPDLWANISNGISSNAAVSSGVGLGVKALIIGVSAVTVGVTAYFIGNFNEPTKQIVETIENPIHSEHDNIVNVELENKNSTTTTVIIAEKNDPVISENKAEIIHQLSNTEAINPVENSTTEATNSFSDPVEVSNTVVAESIEENNKGQNINGEEKSSEETISNPNEFDEIETFKEKIIPTGRIEFLTTQNIFEFEFRANAQNFEKITWNFGDGTVSYEENPIHIFNKVGSYIVELSINSEDNKLYTERKQIEITSTASIDNIPNVITPNGDRVNDEFVINALNIEEFSITITNQLGQTVFKSNDQNFIWNGTDMSGNNVEKTVFNYYILAIGNDGAVLKIPGQLYVR